MKKSRKVIVILLLALLLVAAITVAACTPNTPHVHTYSSQWSYDETEHWHSATCKHDVTADRAAHDYGTDDVCDTCGYTKGQGGSDNPTHQHSFAEQWSSNEIEHWHAATCNHDVTADNAAHTFVNNVCTVCGYQNNVNWDDFVFEPCDGGYMLTKYNGTAAHVNIPDTYNDQPVVSIGEAAFSRIKSLISVTIPDSVTNIGVDAFRNCSSLTWIFIPDSVTIIDYWAFSDCENLATVSFGSNSKLETIWGAFFNCASLTSITIPDSVISIYEAFNGCTNLATVNFGANSELESIGDGAFAYCSNLTSITIPDSVTSIGRHAFECCSSLKSIIIPDSVTIIDYLAFLDCENLATVNFAANSKLERIIDRSFECCSSLISITIPDSVKSMGHCVFDSCYSLVIYCEIFGQPSGWDSEWNEYDGNRCPVVWNCKQNNIADDGCMYDIVDGIRYGFKDNQAKVYGNNYVEDVFAIPSTVEYRGEEYTVTSIYSGAFYSCTGLTSIIIPDSVTSIGECAFYFCPGLTSITIPDSVTSIGTNAFEFCSNLTAVNFGANSELESIGEGAFGYCSNLTSITIPDSVTSISSLAFEDCYSLKSITIPNSVTSIGRNAFNGCHMLVIYCEISEKPSNWNSNWNRSYWLYSGDSYRPIVWNCKRNNVADDGYVYDIVDGIRYGFKDNQAKVYGNNYVEDVFAIPSTVNYQGKDYSVTIIGDYAFYGCSGLISITIPYSVISIGDGTFSGCASLTSITIPESVTSIGYGTFSGCASLTSITIPESVTSIGDESFSYCENLATVTFGANSKLESIGDDTFNGCSSLTSITIPNSITSISYSAFGYCTSLTLIFIPKSVAEMGHNVFFDCTNITIYCEVAEKPSGWNDNWNYLSSDQVENHYCPVVWGATRQDAEQHR